MANYRFYEKVLLNVGSIVSIIPRYMWEGSTILRFDKEEDTWKHFSFKVNLDQVQEILIQEILKKAKYNTECYYSLRRRTNNKGEEVYQNIHLPYMVITDCNNHCYELAFDDDKSMDKVLEDIRSGLTKYIFAYRSTKR